MNKDIEQRIYNISNSFIKDLSKEYEKYISLQKDVQTELNKHKKEEELRNLQHIELTNNLNNTKEETIQAKINYDNKAKELQLETEKYNDLSSRLARDKKDAEANLKETETLKNQVAKQLETNKSIEKKFEDKMRYMKEDENNIEDRKRAVSIRENNVTTRENIVKRGELTLAEENIKLMERKDAIKATEERLKLERGKVHA